MKKIILKYKNEMMWVLSIVMLGMGVLLYFEYLNYEIFVYFFNIILAIGVISIFIAGDIKNLNFKKMLSLNRVYIVEKRRKIYLLYIAIFMMIYILITSFKVYYSSVFYLIGGLFLSFMVFIGIILKHEIYESDEYR